MLKKPGFKTKFNQPIIDTPDSRGQMDSELKVREGMHTRTHRETYKSK